MYRNILSLLIVCLLAASCADDIANRDKNFDASGQIEIPFSVDKVFNTRSTDREFDETIQHIYVLFYAKDSDGKATGTPAAVTKGDVQNSDKLTFYLPSELVSETSYYMLAIANAEYYISAGTEGFDAYLKSKTYSDLCLSHSACITPNSVSGVPMQAIDDTFSFTKTASGCNVTKKDELLFYRMVARVDVSSQTDDFVIEKIAMCNWRDAVYFDEISTKQGQILGQIIDENVTYVDVDGKDESGRQSLNGKLYCFPSIVENSERGDKSTTALIIKAAYNGDSTSPYYRVNLGVNGSLSELKQNTRYTLNIAGVKGKGYPSAKEAYEAKDESQIITAMVEDWDLADSNYVMDEAGNFIIVSKRALEFGSDDSNSQEIKVLASKDLNWSATYEGDKNGTADAFAISKDAGSPLATLTIKPNASNSSSKTLSGICRISATTSSRTISLQINLSQLPSSDAPYTPEIPTDKDFALVPLIGPDRVKVYKENGKDIIEIDGFDPDCFNSFIDIPFRVYVKEAFADREIWIQSNDLKWPLEGRIAKEESKDYYYCPSSFESRSKKSSTTGIDGLMVYKKSLNKDDVYFPIYSPTLHVKNGDIVYISVGAMAPDDPEIKRMIDLKLVDSDRDYQYYDLVIKPRPVIIDDVILTDVLGNPWLIFDRNVQNLNSAENAFIGRKSDGEKRQAYNYVNTSPTLIIPSKMWDKGIVNNPPVAFSEDKHSLYMGLNRPFNRKNEVNTAIDNWIKTYDYKEGQIKNSPFYESDDNTKWKLPTLSTMELCKAKMKVSKLRMFLVSDIPAKHDDNLIPVCCYWPYYNSGVEMGITTDSTFGYYVSNGDGTPQSIILIYCDKTEVKTFILSSMSNYTGLSRLVRSLNSSDLEDYKNNYLGYGSEPHKLTICHPDTQYPENEDWLSY